ncbi:MAG TPA: ATP-binding protein [Myxococcota bacterium]|jgi:hypothetical protein|nr:ATP-binding protein [Myxococcota bacterium]
MSRTLSVVLRLPAEWRRIEAVREAIGRCLEAVFADEELAGALAMVTAELLENAVKYGKLDPGGVVLSVEEDGGGVTVGVTNAVEAASRHVEALRDRVAWIARFADPADAFVAAMAEVFARGDPDADSGLGLARIAHEGGCTLACDESVPGRVTVRASRAHAEPGAAAPAPS